MRKNIPTALVALSMCSGNVKLISVYLFKTYSYEVCSGISNLKKCIELNWIQRVQNTENSYDGRRAASISFMYLPTSARSINRSEWSILMYNSIATFQRELNTNTALLNLKNSFNGLSNPVSFHSFRFMWTNPRKSDYAAVNNLLLNNIDCLWMEVNEARNRLKVLFIATNE